MVDFRRFREAVLVNDGNFTGMCPPYQHSLFKWISPPLYLTDFDERGCFQPESSFTNREGLYNANA